MVEESDPELGGLFSGIEDAKDIEWESRLTPEDRGRGILSKADREYLCGQKEYAHAQSESNRKQDIRERVKNGLKDFTLLWLLLDPTERATIFYEMGNEEADQCIDSMISFAYLGFDQNRHRLADRIEHGVLGGANYDTGGRTAGKATNVDVSIDIDYEPDVDALYEQLQAGKTDQLTPAEIGVLVRAGKVTPENLSELKDTTTPFPGVYFGGQSGEDSTESEGKKKK